MGNAIEINNLTKVYGRFFWQKKVCALDSLNLTVPKGAVFGFLGPNGAGKTTTIRMLMDLIRPTGGSAKVLGMPPDNITVKEKIGFLPDTPAFSSYLTAYEFLNICAKLLKIPSQERRKKIDRVLTTVRMTQHAKSKLGGFSRGMIQRIGIAQAILNDPELLILDEPLVGLDPHGRQELKNIILDQKKAGTNVFFCSHILSDVEKMCDHLGILNEGKLLCAGRIDDLLSATGIRVHIPENANDIARELLPEATGSIKLQDGSWELIFADNSKIKLTIEEIKQERPESITITPSRESLDDFFFRKIENSKTIS